MKYIFIMTKLKNIPIVPYVCLQHWSEWEIGLTLRDFMIWTHFQEHIPFPLCADVLYSL
jgi:hypothetical protein